MKKAQRGKKKAVKKIRIVRICIAVLFCIVLTGLTDLHITVCHMTEFLGRVHKVRFVPLTFSLFCAILMTYPSPGGCI